RLPSPGSGVSKLRPASVLSFLLGPYQKALICGISTQLQQIQPNWDELVDVADLDFVSSGLKQPSVIRLNFLYGAARSQLDLIIIYNSGRFRMAGRGSLSGMMPYGDANQIVLDMAREVLPVVHTTPVLAGVCGTDPFRIIGRFLDEVKAVGFSGVQNFPTVGLIDGTFRQGLEETEMGYGL